MNVEFITDSAKSTSRLGQYFASFLNGGDTIILTGDLGGGKTTFTSGIAKGLGIGQDVSSPSFTLVNEYSTGSKKLIHADLYRLDGAEEIAGIGMDDYIYDPDNIVCIEWGDKMDSSCLRIL
ncbi:MAG: tRNA (adenosine(37)-N6)-threonylcarbamoyltransferase complex ATPase subunit type 1 TsaE [Actinomycetota bacterium]|nr:tRNA (adenosine(37)-N6)-threonylcarbamoyltransferase complex ATPase subunit type 1 TsaE [Actinomycetota bacterium]